jgi:hypothetical protein
VEQSWKGLYCIYEQFHKAETDILPLWLELEYGRTVPRRQDLHQAILHIYHHLEVRCQRVEKRDLFYMARYKSKIWLMFPYIHLTYEDTQKLMLSLEYCVHPKIETPGFQQITFRTLRPMFGDWMAEENAKRRRRPAYCPCRHYPVWAGPEPMWIYRERQYDHKYYYRTQPLSEKEAKEFKKYECVNRLMTLYPKEEREAISLAR